MTKRQSILLAVALLVLVVCIKKAMSRRESQWRGRDRGVISDAVDLDDVDLRDEPAPWSDRLMAFVDGK